MVVHVLLTALALATPYEDLKQRFRVDLPAGWKWAPQPGDTGGMWFKKNDSGAIGNFGVRVVVLGRRAVAQLADEAEAAVAREPGYKRLGEGKLAVAGKSAVRREYVMFVAGSDKTQRRVEQYFFANGGTGYWLHFETLAEGFDLFRKDLDHLLQTFVPISGGQPAGVTGGRATMLIGTWRKAGELLTLELRADNSYHLGGIGGDFVVDAETIVLRVPGQGEQRFHYAVGEQVLTLANPDSGPPQKYQRLERPKPKLPGLWKPRLAAAEALTLSPGGSFIFGKQTGMYRVKGDLLVLKGAQGGELIYVHLLDADILKLSGGDLTQEVIFDRAP